MDIISKNTKYHVQCKLLDVAIQFLHNCHLQWNSYSKSFILNSCTFSIFPAFEKKNFAFVGKILGCFKIILHYTVNSFVVLLYIPVMINISYEMIKILHEKMLNARYFYWFHNDASEKSNSLIVIPTNF